MNSIELRIGNYLGGRNGIVTVSAIQEDGTVWLKEGGKNFIVDSDKPCLLPIKLTEEWLLKFGMTKLDESSTHWYQSDCDFYIFKGSEKLQCSDYFIGIFEGYSVFNLCIATLDDGMENYECLQSIRYVHQLQNLYFALTNEELTYEQ